MCLLLSFFSSRVFADCILSHSVLHTHTHTHTEHRAQSTDGHILTIVTIPVPASVLLYFLSPSMSSVPFCIVSFRSVSHLPSCIVMLTVRGWPVTLRQGTYTASTASTPRGPDQRMPGHREHRNKRHTQEEEEEEKP